MRDADQVTGAVALGVDAIGMIFYPPSPRAVSLDQARAIRQVVPAFVDLVGVFVNQDIEDVARLAEEAGLDLVQLHGDESADYAQQLGRPYVRAIRAKDAEYVSQQIAEHDSARGILIDTYHKDAYGGTGKMMDQTNLPAELPENLIIAGGINETTVKDLMSLKPYAIDVNSGIERAPGDKDLDRLARLISVVNS